jgi:hypothetical protein
MVAATMLLALSIVLFTAATWLAASAGRR